MEQNALELARDSLLIEKIKNSFAAEDAALMTKVYAFAKERASGLDSEAFQAAELLIDTDADAVSISCALLAPILWQDRADLGEVREHFGRKVYATLKNLNPPSILRVDTRQHRKDDTYALLTSMGSDPRNAVLLITFRLLALENVTDSHDENVRQMATETLDLYVPIADRLSLGEIRRRLEDVAFRVLDPEGYECLKQKVIPVQAEDDKCLYILLTGLQRLLNDKGIQGRLQGRKKSLYSIRRKMTLTGKTFEEIMDRIGLRVIVASVPECYAVLGLLHTHFKPIPGTFDDYIGIPKDNGYQSLHTCVYPVREISHKPIEFQVRTELMHIEAEHGAAAHWRYKSEAESKKKDHDQTEWMERLVRQHENAGSAEAFIELLRRQVFRDHLMVFGNGGRIVRLAENATVQDYLRMFNIHVSKNSFVRVNGKIVDMEQILQDGDSIEIAEDKTSNDNEFTLSLPIFCNEFANARFQDTAIHYTKNIIRED